MIPNQRFSIEHKGIKYAYGLDMYYGYFFIEFSHMNSITDDGISRSLSTSNAGIDSKSAIGSDLPFNDPLTLD